MSDEKNQEQLNRFYFRRFLEPLPQRIPWPIWASLLVTLIFYLSGSGIILDSITGKFPSQFNFIRNLFIFNWVSCILLFVLSVHLSNIFYASMYSWIESCDFIADEDPKKLKKTLKRILKISFGPIPIITAIILYCVRYILLSLMEVPPTEVMPHIGNYAYWLLGADISYSFIALISFWSVAVFGFALRKVAQSYPIKITDVAKYKESYEGLIRLANKQIIITAISVAICVFGILYWGLSVGTTQYYLAMFFLLIIVGIGIAIISWLNLSGIQKGLEKTKKEKIEAIRLTKLSPHTIDLQISLHSQISLWKIGPRLIDSFIKPFIAAAFPILLKFALDILCNNFNSAFP